MLKDASVDVFNDEAVSKQQFNDISTGVLLIDAVFDRSFAQLTCHI